MRIQTFSIVVGSSACDANCRFCISHTTGFQELTKSPINKTNFIKAVRLASLGGCTTLLFTGKGEPTLYPAQITEYLEMLKKLEQHQLPVFPLVELQTNAIRLGQIANNYKSNYELTTNLGKWKLLGLNTIAISVVDIGCENNKRIYLHHREIDYPDLAKTVQFLRLQGFTVRICLMLHKDIVDDVDSLKRVIDWCREHEVAQFTFRPLRQPNKVAPGSEEYSNYIERCGVTQPVYHELKDWVHENGMPVLRLMQGEHEETIYDVDGQNVCVSDCLTVRSNGDDIRTLIFYPDGRLTFDWQYKGARLL